MADVLHTHLDRAAAGHADRTAVSSGPERLTYGELDRRSRSFAHLLVESGFAPGDRVAIHQRKSVEMIVAIYGVLRAGCCFVPVDPTSPPDRLRAILQNGGVRAVVTDAAAYEVLVEVGGAAIELVIHPDDVSPAASLKRATHVDWPSVTARPSSGELPDCEPDDLAYVMYTSGSTGPPKGMIHSHRSSLGFARWGLHYCGLGPRDVVANLSPLHFDISIFDIFSSLLGCSSVVLVPQRDQLFPAQVLDLFERERLTVAFTVPFALARLVALGDLGERNLGNLRWILFGGEPFQPQDLAELMRLVPGAQYANVYGPAEAPACVVHEVERPPTGDTPVPIGSLAPETVGRIVQPDSIDPVAPGEIGELLISAPSVTLGYWNRPDLDAATRVYIDGLEFFRTGDLVRERTDGLLDFIGRNDRMIKSRGYRIELDEVEAAVASFDAVAEAAVFAVDHEGTKLVEAAVVPEGALEIGELRRHLSERLPAYAIPSGIHVVDEMPRTTSDKIDRRALAVAHGQGRP